MTRPIGTLFLVICLSARAGSQSPATQTPAGVREVHATASTPPALPPPALSPPSLIVLITIDQFRDDYLDRFGPQLRGGLARFARGGAWFTNAHHDHAITETAPGHATLLSGRFPRSTGITANRVGVEDPTAPLLGNNAAPGASPRDFRERPWSTGCTQRIRGLARCQSRGKTEPRFCRSADRRRMCTGTPVAASQRADTTGTRCPIGSTDSTCAECPRISPERAGS